MLFRFFGEFRHVDSLVLNYLIIEGYKEAAEQFYAEKQILMDHEGFSIDFDMVGERNHIRSAIQSGNIDEAIDRLNDFDLHLVEETPRIMYHLLMQRMIEAVRAGNPEDALAMIQNEIPLAHENEAMFLKELENVLLLVAFGADGEVKESPVLEPIFSSLLSPGHRLKVANEVNAAVLASQGLEKGIPTNKQVN